jgi:hypothetical protein
MSRIAQDAVTGGINGDPDYTAAACCGPAEVIAFSTMTVLRAKSWPIIVEDAHASGAHSHHIGLPAEISIILYMVFSSSAQI